MTKRERISTMSDDIRALSPTLHPPRNETSMYTTVLMLISTNYHLWAISMEVSLEANIFGELLIGVR